MIREWLRGFPTWWIVFWIWVAISVIVTVVLFAIPGVWSWLVSMVGENDATVIAVLPVVGCVMGFMMFLGYALFSLID